MSQTVGRLRQILECEVAVHRELLRLARARHLLLRQGRFEKAADLAVMEAAFIVTLRNLEVSRRHVARTASTRTSAPDAADVAKLARQIATLVRGLGAVERANIALWSQRVLTPVLTAVAAATFPARQARLN